MSGTNTWFAWYPVRLGVLRGNPWVWGRRVLRHRTPWAGMIVTTYWSLPRGRT